MQNSPGEGEVIAIDPTAEILFEYLRDVIYSPAKAQLDISQLPEGFKDLGSGIEYFAKSAIETKALAQALSRGDLAPAVPSRDNEMASPLKSLHASLKHLTWQAQQVAKGDYSQRVRFMGEFSDAFNNMVEQIQQKTSSLEQGNTLLTSLIHHVPQQIFVIDMEGRDILLMNEIARNALSSDPNYLEFFINVAIDRGSVDCRQGIEVVYNQKDKELWFSVKTYMVEWGGKTAEIFVINDISDTKNEFKELENVAYFDALTKLYNRHYGMMTLESWLNERREFVIIFADLDSLKHVNDEYGHNEGDIYIINAAKHLKTFADDAIVARLGGDEFIILAPDIGYGQSASKMEEIYKNLHNDEYVKEKPFSYSISFGIAYVDAKNSMPASELLSIADERMYANKQLRKKERQQQLSH